MRVERNHVELDGRLLQRGALRYTPAGIAALDFIIEHASTQNEAGRPRKVQCKVHALALGEMAVRLDTLKANQRSKVQIKVSGFLAQRAMSDPQLVLHVTAAEIAE